MKKESTRRDFLKNTAIGVIGVGVVSVAPMTTLAENITIPNPYPGIYPQRLSLPSYNPEALFFNPHQYKTVAAITGLIIPSTTGPGAMEAVVVDVIDAQVADSIERKKIYKAGLDWIDTVSQKEFGPGKTFLKLDVRKQIELLREIDNNQQIRSFKANSILGRIRKKINRWWIDNFGMGKNSVFFRVIRQDVISAFYSNPISWKDIGFFGPPQPVGYRNFSTPPLKSNYTGKVRSVNGATCKRCHQEVGHPTEGIIKHSCSRCHNPHSPWPDNENSFHLEDHFGFIFPSPDRNKETL